MSLSWAGLSSSYTDCRKLFCCVGSSKMLDYHPHPWLASLSDAPPGQTELCGRLILMPKAAPWQVEIAPSGSANYLGSVQGGLIWLRRHNPPSSVVPP